MEHIGQPFRYHMSQAHKFVVPVRFQRLLDMPT
jgi:hypothetical protein